MYRGITDTAHKGITVEPVSDYKQYAVENDLLLSNVKQVWYKILAPNEVLLVDKRNYEKKLYTHSEVSGKVDPNGNLSIIIKDSIAVNEQDITGLNSAVLKSRDKIKNVNIEVVENK